MQNTTKYDGSLLGLEAAQLWSTEFAYLHLKKNGYVDSKRTAERRILQMHFLPTILNDAQFVDELGRRPNRLLVDRVLSDSRKKRVRVFFAQICLLPNGFDCLHINDSRGGRFWLPLRDSNSCLTIEQGLSIFQAHIGKQITIFSHGSLAGFIRGINKIPGIQLCQEVYQPNLSMPASIISAPNREISPHLKKLESESIHIIREAVAEAKNPVMMYSIGKDSGVMLHLARKAFFPAIPPFPLLHIDTRWKFQEMYQFRDYMIQESGMQLLTYVNPEAIEKNINPFDHGSSLHTDITKTEGLKQALDHYEFDVMFGGARRDEEKSRAKERIFSFRTSTHQWDPKNQRPELWNLYNTRKNPGESIRVFPLSNWTELDIWQYIYQENIPVVPLYFAKERPVIVKPEMIMLVDDDRCHLFPEDEIEMKKVRFRTLGCYPLTSAIPSNAETIEDILLELINARQSERQGRKIDTDSSGSMEKKKKEGYF